MLTGKDLIRTENELTTIAENIKNEAGFIVFLLGGFTCYLASEIMMLCLDYLDAPVLRVAALDCPYPMKTSLKIW